MTFIVGAVAVCYSISLFLASPNQPANPPSFKISNWSGYIVASDIQNRSPVVSSVSASWTVPEIKLSENNTFSSVWVGIGGYGEDTLIQTGTAQECINGKFVYYAWYELVPDHLVRISNIHVQAGDAVTASISLINENTNSWSIEIAAVSRGERFKRTFVYNSSWLSAEWVMERPKVNGNISTLADFGNVTFTECKATLDDVTGAIDKFSFAQFVMVSAEDKPLVSVSSLDGDGESFTVSYLPSNATSQDYLNVNSFTVLPLTFFILASSRKPYASVSG